MSDEEPGKRDPRPNEPSYELHLRFLPGSEPAHPIHLTFTWDEARDADGVLTVSIDARQPDPKFPGVGWMEDWNASLDIPLAQARALHAWLAFLLSQIDPRAAARDIVKDIGGSRSVGCVSARLIAALKELRDA